MSIHLSNREAARLLARELGPAPKRKRKPTPAAPSEHAIQADLVARIAARAADHPALRLLYSVPNGGHRHAAVAGKMKAEGQRAGVPDLVLPVARGGWHGLFVEMKRPGGKVSAYQRWWLDALAEQGYYTVVCYGADEAEQTILNYVNGVYYR
jgi:hypothetical protein